MNLLRFLIGLSMLGFSLAGQAQWTSLPAAGQVSVPLDAEPGAIALAGATRVLAVGTASPAGVVLVNPDSGAIISRIALSARPRALAIDASAGKVYVIDDDSANSVKVLDVATATVVANWSLGGDLSALALTPSGNQLIVADRAGKKLLTIAVANGTLLRVDTLAGKPELLAFGKQGSRLLVGLHGGRLLTLDAATYGVLGELPTGDEIRGLAWWDDGDMALTVGKNADALNYFPGGTVVSPPATPISGDPRELSTDEALDRAFVTTPRDMSVYRIELATRQIAGRYPLPGRTRSLIFDPLARMLLLPLIDDRSLLRLDPQAATLVSPLLLGKGISALAVNPVTHKAAVVADKAQELSKIDIGLRTAEILALPAKPRLVAIDSAIDRAVIAAGPNAKIVHFVDLATGVLLPETILAEYGIVALAVDSTRGLALALRKKTDGLLVIDTRNRTVIASISLDADYSSLAIHSARGIAYLGGRQRITPLDLTSLTLGSPRTVAIHAEALAVDEALDVLVATDRPSSGAHVFRLTDFSVRDVYTLPLRPAALAIQPDTHVAVIASPESDALSTVNLETGAVQPGFVTVEKPFALAVSQRYNQALVLSAKTDLLEFVQLPNPLPRFDALNPNRALVGTAALVINAEGGNFVDGAKVIFGTTTLVTRWIHSGRLEADLPASLLATAGTISVRVRNPAPAGGDSVARSFEVLPPPPVLSTVAPALLEAEGVDRTITLTGQNFTAASLVVFDGQTIGSQFVDATQLTATVPGSLLATERVAPVWVTTVSGQSNTIDVTVETARPVIDAISPTTGAPGITVTISGRGFDAVASGNQVRFGESGLAEVVSATRTQVVAKVPATARTGAVSLATSKGVASGPVFTVIREQDFDLTVSPATTSVYQGAGTSVALYLNDQGSSAFAGLVELSVVSPPAGVTVSFSTPALSRNQNASITLSASTGATPGVYPILIRGQSLISGVVQSRSVSLTLSVLASAGVTGVKGRFVTPDGRGISNIIVRVEDGPATQSDSAGNFTLTGLPAGDVTLRLDATPANPLYPIWPYSLTTEAGKVLVLEDWTINPPPPDERFTPIANATQDQVVTDERFPGLAITLPAGVSIIGWDGVPKKRIAVERLLPDQLPVSAPPFPMREAYQLYFGTPMGGMPTPATPIPVALPNVAELEPGEQTDIWYYDGSPLGGAGEWKIAGQGTVSADGRSISSNPGSGIPRFCGVCGLVSVSCPTPPIPPQPPPGNACQAGNPIDLATGQQMPRTGGLSCGGLTPIYSGLNYNPVDAFNGRAGTFGSFGLGWTSDYDVAFLPFVGPQKRLILPGGQFVNFVDDGSGRYKPFDDPRFDGAQIRATNAAANEWELTFKDGRIWRFKPFAGIPGVIRGGPPTFVTEMKDPSGNSVIISRQSTGRITAVGRPERNVTMSYGANGFVSEVRDSAGRAMRYTYTSSNRIQTITDADDKVTRYTYVDDTEIAPDPVCAAQIATLGERIKTISYPGRPTPTTNFYGSSRRVLRQSGFDGREFHVSYKVSGACVTHIAKPGVRCSGVACPTEDSWENFQAGWRFHGGRIVGFTLRNPDSSTRSATFNSRGLPLSSTGNLGLGQPVFAKYDAANRPTENSDVSGRIWRSTFDANGNLTRRVDPLGRVTEIDYDLRWNKPIAITRYLEGQPVTTRMQYDPVTSRLTRAIDPLGNALDAQYGPRGELVQLNAPLGRVTRLEYNADGDLINVIDPMGAMAQFATDGAGRTTATTDPLGYVTRTEYTGVSEVAKVIDPLQQEASSTYDPAGRIASVINTANVPVQTYQYDAGDRVTQVSDALSVSTGYQYDAAGRLTQMTDRRGRITRYFYDDAGRVTRMEFPDGERLLHYDALDRVQSIQDSPGTSVSYTYDEVDRVVREEQVLDGLTTVIENTYDELDRRIRRTINGQDPTTYTYDLAGRLTAITYRGQTTRYNWDEAGRLTSKTMPNGIAVNYEYDLNDRETRISYQRTDGILIENIVYEYDAAGQRIRRAATVGSVPESPFAASYNAADRMTQITLNPGTANARTYTLAYDANGNLTQKTNLADPSDTTTYIWDSRNRLTGIQGSGLTASFRYDALNRRVEKTVNGQSVRYVYDGPQAIMEITGGQNTNLLTGLDTDEVIARYTQSGRTIYLQDALMSVIAQTRDDQSVQNFYGYSPYGEAGPTADDQGNALEYTGRENDSTGLYYYRARYYDPILKRFVSEDPIGLAGGLNLYGYVGGSPTNLIDPTGNASTCYSAGPGCSGAGSGIYKQPSGGGRYKAVMRGGYIVRWEPCNSITIPPDPCTPGPGGGGGAGSNNVGNNNNTGSNNQNNSSQGPGASSGGGSPWQPPWRDRGACFNDKLFTPTFAAKTAGHVAAEVVAHHATNVWVSGAASGIGVGLSAVTGWQVGSAIEQCYVDDWDYRDWWWKSGPGSRANSPNTWPRG